MNDLFVYRTFAAPVLDGGLPYRDVAFEYPPLAAPAIALPGLAGTGEDAFRWAFAVWTLAAARRAVVLLCGALRRGAHAAATAPPGDARRRGHAAPLRRASAHPLRPVPGRARPRRRSCCSCATGRGPASPCSALAVMTKAFPIVVAPVALAWLLARGRRRDALAGRARVRGGDGGDRGRRRRRVAGRGARRGRATSSTARSRSRARRHSWCSAWMRVGAGHAASVKSFRSDGLLHPASDAVTSLFLTALVVLVALLCVTSGAPQAGAGRDRGSARAGAGEPGRACAGSPLLGKVLSPQFVIWVLPLGALAFAWRMYALAAAVALVAVLTQVEFPAHYFDVVAREPLAIGVVASGTSRGRRDRADPP